MKRTLLFVFLLSLWGTIFTQETGSFAKDQLILKFKDVSLINQAEPTETGNFGISTLDEINALFGVEEIALTGHKKMRNSYLINFTEDQDILNLVKVYENTHLFEYVEPNFIGNGGGMEGFLPIVPDDTHFSRQWGLYNDGTFSLSNATEDADIDMELAWDIEQGNEDIIIAVLDAGLKLDHPDIINRLWNNPNESDNNSDDDNNGYADDLQGWDFANDDSDPTDDHGHGTNVTGIIGCDANNELGYAGVDWHAQIMTCKILDANNSGFYSWWTEAIYYAVDNGASVMNMSVGGSSFSASMEEAVDYAYDNGVTIVACMMNEDAIQTFYPAGYENTIAVGSTNPDDERTSPFFWSSSSGSNYGNHIDVVAPGHYIYGISFNSNTNYNSYWGGTSQATPLVTGLCGLLLAQDPSRSPDDLRNIIRNTAEDQVGDTAEDIQGFDIYYGYGRVNAHQALLDNPTNLDEINASSEALLIFPNPAREIVRIKTTHEMQAIHLLNMMGELVLVRSNANENELVNLDLSGLSSGVYLLNALNSNGQIISTQKLTLER